MGWAQSREDPLGEFCRDGQELPVLCPQHLLGKRAGKGSACSKWASSGVSAVPSHFTAGPQPSAF